MVPTPWYGSRRTGLKTVMTGATGASSRLGMMADWLEVAAEAAAAVAVYHFVNIS